MRLKEKAMGARAWVSAFTTETEAYSGRHEVSLYRDLVSLMEKRVVATSPAPAPPWLGLPN